MGHAYQAVQWNRQKKRYDLFLALGVVLYMALFVGVSAALRPEATAETLMIRALGTCSFLLLHVVLAIGPLARIDARWLPLLYNRRHLGVTMCGLAFLHGALSLVQFHAFGDVNPFVSLLTSNTRFDSLAHFPFQPLGAAALVILVLMAATSHDFWLANLTAPVWKALHMLVYVAYALILVMHVALGILQAETSPLLCGRARDRRGRPCWALHAVAALREATRAGRRRDTRSRARVIRSSKCVAVDDDAEEDRARIDLSSPAASVLRCSAIDGKISAVSNVCQHQNGPLGEGRDRRRAASPVRGTATSTSRAAAAPPSPSTRRSRPSRCRSRETACSSIPVLCRSAPRPSPFPSTPEATHEPPTNVNPSTSAGRLRPIRASVASSGHGSRCCSSPSPRSPAPSRRARSPSPRRASSSASSAPSRGRSNTSPTRSSWSIAPGRTRGNRAGC